LLLLLMMMMIMLSDVSCAVAAHLIYQSLLQLINTQEHYVPRRIAPP
jgi:hypothetical protein